MFFKSLGIQSPSENGFMEPKYLAFWRWWRTPLAHHLTKVIGSLGYVSKGLPPTLVQKILGIRFFGGSSTPGITGWGWKSWKHCFVSMGVFFFKEKYWKPRGNRDICSFSWISGGGLFWVVLARNEKHWQLEMPIYLFQSVTYVTPRPSKGVKIQPPGLFLMVKGLEFQTLGGFRQLNVSLLKPSLFVASSFNSGRNWAYLGFLGNWTLIACNVWWPT